MSASGLEEPETDISTGAGGESKGEWPMIVSPKHSPLPPRLKGLHTPPADRDVYASKAIADFLRTSGWEFTKGLKPDALQLIGETATLRLLNTGDTLHRQAGIASNMYVVVEGEIGLYLPDMGDAEEIEYGIKASKARTTGGRKLTSMRQECDRIVALAKKLAKVLPSLKAKPKRREATSFFRHRHEEADSVVELPRDECFDAEGAFKAAVHSVQMAQLVAGALGLEEGPRRMLEVARRRVGQSAGELGTAARNKRHIVTARSRTATTVIAIPRETYMRLGLSEGDISDTISFLKSLNAFRFASPAGLLRVAYRVRQTTVPRGTVIVEEGETAPVFYIVRKGSCRVEVRHVLPEGPEDSDDEDEGGKSKEGKTTRARGVLHQDGKPKVVKRKAREPTKARRVIPLGVAGDESLIAARTVLTKDPCEYTYVAETQVRVIAMSATVYAYIRKSTYEDVLQECLNAELHRARRLHEVGKALVTAGKPKSDKPALGKKFTKNLIHANAGRLLNSSGPLQWSGPEKSSVVLPRTGAWSVPHFTVDAKKGTVPVLPVSPVAVRSSRPLSPQISLGSDSRPPSRMRTPGIRSPSRGLGGANGFGRPSSRPAFPSSPARPSTTPGMGASASMPALGARPLTRDASAANLVSTLRGIAHAHSPGKSPSRLSTPYRR